MAHALAMRATSLVASAGLLGVVLLVALSATYVVQQIAMPEPITETSIIDPPAPPPQPTPPPRETTQPRTFEEAPVNTPPLTFNNGNGHDEVRVLSGGHTFTSDLSPALRNVTVKVDSGATANFNSTQHLEKLNIDGLATLNAGGGKVLVTGELNLGAAGKLDLKDNDLIVHYSSVSPVGIWTGSNYDGVTGLVQSGRNGGAWDGPRGIISSSATSRTTLGVAETKDFGLLGTQTGPWFGQSGESTSVRVQKPADYNWPAID